jgi:hypothetical protein
MPALELSPIRIPGAMAGNRFVASRPFEISRSSPLALAAAAAIMMSVSLLAAFIPAHRASRVEPAIALRAEAIFSRFPHAVLTTGDDLAADVSLRDSRSDQ